MNLFQSSRTVGMEAAVIAFNLFQFPPQSGIRRAHSVSPDQEQYSHDAPSDHYKRNQKD